MTEAGWVIRIVDPEDYNKEVDMVGNYVQFKSRFTDTVTAFSGLFGVDFLIWEMHDNIMSYDFSGVLLELELHEGKNTNLPIWHKFYNVIDARYNDKLKKFVIFAITEDTAVLLTNLLHSDVVSLPYNEARTPKQLLTEVLEKNYILNVRYHKHTYDDQLANFNYGTFAFENNWTVCEFINYVAEPNIFEWCIRNFCLHIGIELSAIEDANSGRKEVKLVDKLSDSLWFKKLESDMRPINLLYHINKTYKCVWVKHVVGTTGGLTKACFTTIGSGSINKEIYLKSLEGETERTLTLKNLHSIGMVSSAVIGAIVSDTGEEQYIDKISIQKNEDLLKINQPYDVKIDDGKDSTKPAVQLKERVSRTTPYMDDGAGLLFPITDSENPPNSILLSIDGKEESCAQIGFVLGKNKGITIPKKDKNDFRFSMKDGFTVYKKADGMFYIQLLDTDVESVPTQDNTKVHFYLDEDGNIKINQSENAFIEIDKDKNVKISQNENGFIEIDKDGAINLQKDANSSIKITKEGKIVAQNQNDIEIKNTIGSIKIASDGTITIDSTLPINIGATAPSIQLGGSGALSLSQSIHTHNTGNLGIPIPPPNIGNTIKVTGA